MRHCHKEDGINILGCMMSFGNENAREIEISCQGDAEDYGTFPPQLSFATLLRDLVVGAMSNCRRIELCRFLWVEVSEA